MRASRGPQGGCGLPAARLCEQRLHFPWPGGGRAGGGSGVGVGVGGSPCRQGEGHPACRAPGPGRLCTNEAAIGSQRVFFAAPATEIITPLKTW